MYIHIAVAFIFSSIIRIFSFVINLVVSLINKDYGKLIEQFINAHYFLFSGIFILFGIIYYDSNIASIGSFPESWNCLLYTSDAADE